MNDDQIFSDDDIEALSRGILEYVTEAPSPPARHAGSLLATSGDIAQQCLDAIKGLIQRSLQAFADKVSARFKEVDRRLDALEKR